MCATWEGLLGPVPDQLLCLSALQSITGAAGPLPRITVTLGFPSPQAVPSVSRCDHLERSSNEEYNSTCLFHRHEHLQPLIKWLATQELFRPAMASGEAVSQ